MNQISLNAREMKTFLHHMISNNRHIQSGGKVPVSTEVIGDSGLGKTSIVLQVASEFNIDCVKLNLAQIEELGDLVGFPMRQFQMIKKPTQEKIVKTADGQVKRVRVAVEGNPKMEWVDEHAVDEYTRQGFKTTGKNRMSYCPPEWIADKKGGGILILDDWNRADIRFIQAVMELVDRQEYISWKLPEDWHILLTANPDNGEYLVNTIDTAQRTRFVSTSLKWDHECWAEWAEGAGVDGRCINFVLMHPEVVNARVNPRSLTTFFNCISSIKSFEDELPLIQMVGEGSVGPEVATLFTSFINNRLDKLITPKEILLGQGHDAILKKLKESTGEGNDFRADIASIITTRTINYALYYAEKNSITPEITERLIKVINTPDVLTDDLKYVIVKKIVNGNKLKFKGLLVDTKVQQMVTK